MTSSVQEKSTKTDSQTLTSVPTETIEGPIVNASAIINASPIVNADDAGGTCSIISNGSEEETQEEFQEYMSAGCAAVVPAGARKIYLVMVTVTMLVGAVIVYGLFKLLDL